MLAKISFRTLHVHLSLRCNFSADCVKHGGASVSVLSACSVDNSVEISAHQAIHSFLGPVWAETVVSTAIFVRKRPPRILRFCCSCSVLYKVELHDLHFIVKR